MSPVKKKVNKVSQAKKKDVPAKKKDVREAAIQFADVVKIFLDEKDNKKQVAELLKESMEAGRAGYKLMGNLSAGARRAAIIHFMIALAQQVADEAAPLEGA